jgi:hypothetical protein
VNQIFLVLRDRPEFLTCWVRENSASSIIAHGMDFKATDTAVNPFGMPSSSPLSYKPEKNAEE